MRKIFIKLFFTILLLFNTSGCTWIGGSGGTFGAGTPFLRFTKIKIPDGTPKFKRGFEHGCSSGLNTRGNYFYRARFKHYIDPTMIDDPEYSFGYKRGYSYCFTYMTGSGHMSGASDLYILPFGTKAGGSTTFEFGMGRGDLKDSWDQKNTFDLGMSGVGNTFSTFQKSDHDGTATAGPYGGGGVLGSHLFWGSPDIAKGQIFGTLGE